MATGVDLIISTLCNATLCGGNATLDEGFNDIQKPNLMSKVLSQSWLQLERLANQHTLKMLAKDLNGKHLKITTYDDLPMSMSRASHRFFGTQFGRGVAFFVVEILREKFNFTYEIVLPKKNFLMARSDPEDSVLGLVSSGKVDMGAAFVPNILEFRKLVTFSIPMDEETWVMTMKRPTESAVGEGLLAPFTDYVWYLILIAVATFGPFISSVSRIRDKLIPHDEAPIPIRNSIWFVYGAFIKQATSFAPISNTTRVLFTTWWLFIMLLSAFYAANLTAFLTLSEFTLEIQSPRDLYEKNRFWFANEGSAVQFMVTSPSSNLYYFNEMIKRGRARFYTFPRKTDYLKLVDNGSVIVGSRSGITHAMYYDYLHKTKNGVPEANKCAYVIAPKPFTKNQRGFVYPKNSTLQPVFDEVIGIIIQSGMIDRFKNLLLPDATICPLDLQSKERKLQNTDLVMTYKIIAGGICLAIAAFIGEIIVERFNLEKYNQKENKAKAKFNKNATVHHFENDSRPPPYEAIFGKPVIKLPKDANIKIINGREYMVVNTEGGIRLVPVRTPSALLFKVE